MVTSVELARSLLLLQMTPPPPGWPIPPPLDGSACEGSGPSLTPLYLPPLVSLIRLSRNNLDSYIGVIPIGGILAFVISIGGPPLVICLASWSGRRMGQPAGIP